MSIPFRLRALLTGDIEWEGGDKEHLSWRDRWSLFGIHSYNWRWVRTFGNQDCGCVINPVTRQFVMYSWDCVKNERHR